MHTRINQAAWIAAAKQHVKEDLGGRWFCEVCGKNLTEQTAKRHHKYIPRSATTECFSWNVEIRCRDCEKKDPHKVAKGEESLPSNQFSVQIKDLLGDQSPTTCDRDDSNEVETLANKPVKPSGRMVTAYDWGETDSPVNDQVAVPVKPKQEGRFATTGYW